MNEPTSSIIHFIALGLAIAGLVLMIVNASHYGNAWHIVTFSIFGAGMIFLYLTSSIYHIIPKYKKSRKVFQRLDHAMIYFLIAATYTPVCLIALRGPWGWTIFGIVWAIAVIGIIIKSTGIKMNIYLSTFLYIGMGWLMVVAFYPLAKSMPLGALVWLFIGGISYTIGTIFFGLHRLYPGKRWYNWHDVFHLFVLAGSFAHFWMMFRYLVFI